MEKVEDSIGSDKSTVNSNYPLVSIIIPTYNSEKTLEKCLASICKQTYKNIEVIVVDGGSNDRTLHIAKKFGARVYILEGEERSASINYGVSKSRGKYIYRVDSDVILEPAIVEECVKKCEIEGYDAVSILWVPDPTISFWAKVRKLEKECYKHDLSRVGARFLRKDIFEAVRGFNEKLVAGEDYDLYNRLKRINIKIGTIESKEIHIGEPKSVRDIIKKNYYYGKTIREFIKSNGTEGLQQINPVRIVFIKNWKKFVKHPVLMIGFILYYFIVYSSALVGFLAGYWSKGSRAS